MINRVVLVGRMTRDAELKYTTNGSAVASFSLAVSRQFTNANGERETDFINAVIWRKAAENFVNFTTKGSLVAIEGRLQSRSYENQQGQRVYVTEVVVDNFSLLDTREQTDARRNQAPAQQPSQSGFNAAPAQNPFNGQQASQTNDPFGGSQEVDISDDDLPF